MKKKQYVLKAASDNDFVYGILSVNKDVDEKILQTSMAAARGLAMKNDKWCIEDALDMLPEQWGIELESFGSVYI